MASQTFFCPHCRTQLNKSAQAFILGEAYEHNTTVFISGSKPADTTCPRCGGVIDSMKMIRGEYDPVGFAKASGKNEGWYILGMIAAPFVFRFVFHWSWLASILVGFLAGAILAGIIVETVKPTKK